MAKKTKKIVVTVRKGGVGKTTTAVNLATILHNKGKRVLLVDLDPQANATLAVGVNPLALKYSINDLFTSIEVLPHQAIVKTDFSLSLLPSHPSLGKTEAGMQATQVGMIKGLLAPLEEYYDFIIMDTPPSESYLAVNALVSADEVILPVQTHFLALQGLAQVMDDIKQVRNGLNPLLKISGILPTLVNQRTNISKTILDEIKKEYAELLYPIEIDYSVKHIEASLGGQPIVIYDPKHQGSIAYTKLANTFL